MVLLLFAFLNRHPPEVLDCNSHHPVTELVVHPSSRAPGGNAAKAHGKRRHRGGTAGGLPQIRSGSRELLGHGSVPRIAGITWRPLLRRPDAGRAPRQRARSGKGGSFEREASRARSAGCSRSWAADLGGSAPSGGSRAAPPGRPGRRVRAPRAGKGPSVDGAGGQEVLAAPRHSPLLSLSPPADDDGSALRDLISNLTSVVPRGYCFECPVPWHPHAALYAPSLPPVSAASIPQLWWDPLLPSSYETSAPAVSAGSTYSDAFAPLQPQFCSSTSCPLSSSSPISGGEIDPFVLLPRTRPLLHPLQLPAPGVVSPALWAVRHGMTPGRTQPYFTFPSPPPFALAPTRLPYWGGAYANVQQPQILAPALAPAQGQTQAQAQAAPDPAQAAAPKPRERRGADRQATSLSSTRPPRDGRQVTLERIVGEIAFQLDRRILSNIFPDRIRLYGYTVGNIPEKISQGGNDPLSPLTVEQRTGMMDRYNDIMNQLKPIGYDPNYHPQFTEHIVNTYGILRERPDIGAEGDIYNDTNYLREVIENIVPLDNRVDCIVLLNCLQMLSQADGKPLFIW